MEDSRCRIAAIGTEDPRCSSLISGVAIEMEDHRCRGLLQGTMYTGAVIQIDDPRCNSGMGIAMEDPRCGNLGIW